MNKKLILALVLLAIPAFVFADSTFKNQQRYKNARLMNETTQQMLQLTFAIQFYSRENKGKMPPMQNPAVLKQALKPYASKDIFISAATGKPFMPNAKQSGKPLVESNRIVWCYDVKPISGPNNPKELYRVVGFSNHVITMPEKRWQREKKNFGLP